MKLPRLRRPERSDATAPANPEDRLAQLQAWEQTKPTIGISARLGPVQLGAASSALTKSVKELVPTAAIESALRYANAAATRTADEQSLLKHAGVETVEALRLCALDDNDALARHVRNRGMMMAASSGMATGAGGAALMAVDIPTLITVCLRTIHRTAMAYGYRLDGPAGEQLAIGLFALASSNTQDEKQRAIQALSAVSPEDLHTTELAGAARAAWREGVERAAEREVAKAAVSYSIGNLARQLGINLAKRKAAAVIPVVGAIAGGSVNAWTIHDLSKNLQQAFTAWRMGYWGAHTVDAYEAAGGEAVPSQPGALDADEAQ